MGKPENPNDINRELEGDEVHFPPGYTLDEDFASYFEKEMNNYLDNFYETFEFYLVPPGAKFVYKKEMKETLSELANAFKKGYDKVEDPCADGHDRVDMIFSAFCKKCNKDL